MLAFRPTQPGFTKRHHAKKNNVRRRNAPFLSVHKGTRTIRACGGTVNYRAFRRHSLFQYTPPSRQKQFRQALQRLVRLHAVQNRQGQRLCLLVGGVLRHMT